jgi:hypothetical protein
LLPVLPSGKLLPGALLLCQSGLLRRSQVLCTGLLRKGLLRSHLLRALHLLPEALPQNPLLPVLPSSDMLCAGLLRKGLLCAGLLRPGLLQITIDVKASSSDSIPIRV